MASLLDLLKQKLGTPDAQDRYTQTPINFKDNLMGTGNAYGQYIPPWKPGGVNTGLGNGIFLDSSVKPGLEDSKNDPFISYWDKNVGNSTVDAHDILRHEIIHAAANKYGVKNKDVNYGSTNDMNSLIKEMLQNLDKTRGTNEALTTPLTSMKGNYMPQSNLQSTEIQPYQKYLLHSLANSPNVHPAFRAILRKMGYGI